MRVKNIRADQVKPGDYIWVGSKDRHGNKIHPAYHWTRVTAVVAEKITCTLGFGGYQEYDGVKIETADGWYIKSAGAAITIRLIEC